ncbi:bile acid:sodium symporter family protein [Pacificimonas pallii]|uniref:bile acid:sodium symporter family protein n=1 Tax=Pacificimonas pallii TaxID=2827236 RepID=UPI0034E23649
MTVLILAVVAASLLPVEGDLARVMDIAAYGLIMFMFFFHGVRLPGNAIFRAFTNWRLHGGILAVTFLLFPLAGIGLSSLASAWLPAGVAAGLLYLTLVPSTVQSSVAFTAAARGNVAAGVAAAATSNIAGVIVTPLLVAGLMGAASVGAGSEGVGGNATLKVIGLLLVPFLIGHLSRRWLAEWAAARKSLLGITDKSAIILIVYTAFSAAVLQGIWIQLGPPSLAILVALSLLLLGAVNLICWYGGARFAREDRLTFLFCGTQKSLAAGAPMASLLFAPAQVGELLLPLMIYHQAQLLLAAFIAPRLAAPPQSP